MVPFDSLGYPPRKRQNHRVIYEEKREQQAVSLLHVVRTVYCFTTTENLLLATSSAGIANAISRANPSGNCGTPLGGGRNAPAVRGVLTLHFELLS